MEWLDPRLLWAVCALGLLWLGAKLSQARELSRAARAGRLANARGALGERNAEKLLEKLGYRIHARKVEGSYALDVDGESVEVRIEADLLVERDGTRWVAEVKTGRQAPRLQNADTRRQMLEYQLGFEVPGVLLVDVEARRVREVRFPLPSSRPSRNPSSVGIYLLTALALAASAFAWLRD